MLLFLHFFYLIFVVSLDVLLASEQLIIFVFRLNLRVFKFFLKFINLVFLLVRAHFVINTVVSIVCRLTLVFKCFTLVVKLLHFGFLSKYFVTEGLNHLEFSLNSWAFRVSILYIKYVNTTIITNSKQHLIIKTQAHSSDWCWVSLNLINLLQVASVNLNRARSIVLT